MDSSEQKKCNKRENFTLMNRGGHEEYNSKPSSPAMITAQNCFGSGLFSSFMGLKDMKKLRAETLGREFSALFSATGYFIRIFRG